jgi:hypothetical protein
MKRKIADSTGRAVEQFNPVPPPTEVVREGDVLALVGRVLDLANFMALHD